ncbi:pentatricopeptide repeat-containing protein At1g12775, mitochondrial-like [Neltuma alba]|uniref:pentatricopeptide repeat-containing protein At1g12775, mitochondrial-like n=1 Tax=Neltuma alba TaxID=207710 RepID=UPI0010A43C88|nr:pentatricopeptide repeat-containing protein At1g12775, mitochondrial-like [Prosopis alba]
MPFSSAMSSLRDSVASFHRLLSMSPPPSIVEINKILGSLAKTTHCTTAISLSAQAELKGFRPCLVTLNILINCYCLVGDITSAFSLLGKTFKWGYRPNTITMTTLMKGLCMKDVGQALDFHDDLLAKGFCLSPVTYGTLVSGLCKAAKTRCAVKLLQMMGTRQIKTVPNVVIYTIVIDGLCKEGLLSEASKLCSEMIRQGISPNIVTYNTLICGFSNTSQLQEAIRLLNEIVMKGITPTQHTFNIFIDAFCKRGRTIEAQAVFAKMMKCCVKPNVVIFNSLMNGYCMRNDFNESVAVFNKMIRADLTPTVWSYNILINAHCKLKGWIKPWFCLMRCAVKICCLIQSLTTLLLMACAKLRECHM